MGELDDGFPKAAVAEEEFDLLGALDGTGEFRGRFAARALEQIDSPEFEDQVTPEGAHETGGLFLRRWDEEDLKSGIVDFRLMIVDFGLLIFRSRGDEMSLASGSVGLETVVADGLTPMRSVHAEWLRIKQSRYRGGALLGFWQEMVDDGGDEIGGFEDFEDALGGVVALRAVDDGLGGGVPSDFLEGEGVARLVDR